MVQVQLQVGTLQDQVVGVQEARKTLLSALTLMRSGLGMTAQTKHTYSLLKLTLLPPAKQKHSW